MKKILKNSKPKHKTWEESINITPEEIDQLDNGHFLVESQTP